MIRMISGIGIPSSQSRIGISDLLFRVALDGSDGCCLADRHLAPCAVTSAATLQRGERRAERADEERKRQPDSGMHCGLSGLFQICLGLIDHVVDALFGIRLAQSGSRGNE